MSQPDIAKFAKILNSLYFVGFSGKSPGRFTILNTTICKHLKVRYLWPSVLNRLVYELGRKKLLLVPFEDRYQVISSEDVLRPRKLPSGKHKEILEEKPELVDSPAEILRELYETRFNRRSRGVFRARPEEISAICNGELLTPERIQELADELNALPLYRKQKTVRQGYTLVDGGGYLVVIESKVVWNANLCSDEDLESRSDIE